ncbi:MAG: hypothetical protein Q9222_000259 [Ikaeria aurantiellina]
MPCLEYRSSISRVPFRQLISGAAFSPHSWSASFVDYHLFLINLVPRPPATWRRFETVRHLCAGKGKQQTHTNQDDRIIPYELPESPGVSLERSSVRHRRNKLGRPDGNAQSDAKIEILPAAATSETEQPPKAGNPLAKPVGLPPRSPSSASTEPSASPSRTSKPDSLRGNLRSFLQGKKRYAQDLSSQIRSPMIKRRKPKVGESSAPPSLSRPRLIHHGSPTTKRETWQIQKSALSSKFGSAGWAPRKRLSPDALEGIRALHAEFPAKYSTAVLANQFEVSAEAIRRILKSKWRPNDDETSKRRQRWDKRGERIWSQMVALGVKPPKKWRDTDDDGKDAANSSLRHHASVPSNPGVIPLSATVFGKRGIINYIVHE